MPFFVKVKQDNQTIFKSRNDVAERTQEFKEFAVIDYPDLNNDIIYPDFPNGIPRESDILSSRIRKNSTALERSKPPSK